MAEIADLVIGGLRLSRWGGSIQLADNPGPAQSYTRPAISEEEARIARQLLGEIQLAFWDAEKYAQQYKTKKPNPSSTISEVCGSNGDGDLVVLAAKTRELAMRGRKSAGILQKTKSCWFLRDASSGIDETIESATQQAIDASAPYGHTFKKMKADKTARMQNGDEVAEGARVTGFGHSYEDISAKDQAKVFNENRYLGKDANGFWDD
ncbi:hypothetical protein LTR16_003405 [Cryomyces antarcticus]|uniref:Prion-inhibition and propagation HeLo domain-containing protein n=1 Tax=Cryomyces antarcticus TaxID=329879 RepID=A0ABR0M757_9PEZI|nr:hypothetical protein LTR16_003405 [Cryomyces antarcticus]